MNRHSDWDKLEIQRLTSESGRPLEIVCAAAFLEKGWSVRPGTYFEDAGKVRELDVYGEKTFTYPAPGVEIKISLRVLVSVKGFPTDTLPITYSIASSNSDVFEPCLINVHRTPRSNGDWRRAKELADRLLSDAKLPPGRQVIGFDIYRRDAKQNKANEAVYRRLTDRDLYEGLDSAIKAANYWRRRDIQGNSVYSLYLPVLVTSVPFWDVPIDDGRPGDPEIHSKGFTVGLYPGESITTPSAPVMSILWTADELGDLANACSILFECFKDSVRGEVARS